MTSNLAIAQRQIIPPDELRRDIQNEGMVEAIRDPGEEGVHLEEGILLSELVKLWVSIQQAR